MSTVAPAAPKTKKTKKPAKSKAQKIQVIDDGDILMFDPTSIEIADELATRWKPLDKTKVAKYTEDFLGETGQLQPIGVRTLDNGKKQLIFGRTRLDAALAAKKKRPSFEIQVKDFGSISDQMALAIGLKENIRRNQASPVDQAVAHQKLREGGMNDRTIAKSFDQSPSWVGQLKRILALDEAILGKVHDGTLGVTAAVELVGLDKNDQAKVVAQLEEENKALAKSPSANGSPKQRRGRNAKLKMEIRKRKAASGNVDRVIGRTMKECRDFFTGLTGPAEPLALRKLAKGFQAFSTGKKSEAWYEKLLRKYLTDDKPSDEAVPPEDEDSGTVEEDRQDGEE